MMASDGGGLGFDGLVQSAYDELRGLAHRIRSRQLLHPQHDTTSLVHETFLKLSKSNDLQVSDEEHLHAIAARTMRQLIIDLARKHGAEKRGGGRARQELHDDIQGSEAPSTDLLDLDQALDRLAALDPRKSQVVELRFFAGCTAEQAAAVLDVSVATVHREWDFARSWIYRELSRDER
ncbi:MAG: ECF-type sigma factor [Planctomycetota bacterium]